MTEHIHLDWSIDWKEQTIGGSVQHTMRAVESTSVAIFDSSYLTIKSVTTASGTPLEFDLPPRHKVMGSPLKITLPRELKKGETIDLVISYQTTKDSTSLGWLKPGQTASGLYPFLFSQCQVIYVSVRRRTSAANSKRSLIDSPCCRPSTAAPSFVGDCCLFMTSHQSRPVLNHNSSRFFGASCLMSSPLLQHFRIPPPSRALTVHPSTPRYPS